MIQRKFKVLILGEVPEIGDIFERPVFTDDLPTTGIEVTETEGFSAALEAAENYDLIVLDLEAHGLEVLEMVRDYRPVAPVIGLADADQFELVLEALRRGLEDYVIRAAESALTTDLAAAAIEIQLRRFVEPPNMRRPSADQMYRYAHFENVLEPFFVVSTRRHLMYFNRAGREMVEAQCGHRPMVGDPLEEWYLEPTLEDFQTALDRAFAGHEVVNRRKFSDEKADEQLHELYYRPVVDPTGRVVATTIAIHEPGRPQLQRARTTQAVTRFAGGVAHQMNNLLNVLTANLDLLEEQLAEREDGEIRGRMGRLRHGVDRAAELTHQMQAYSRTAVTQREALSVDTVLEEMAEHLHEAVGGEVDLELRLDAGGLTVRMDREQLEMAIGSLVSNAAEASRRGGVVTIRTYPLRVRDWETAAQVSSGLYLVLEVEDQGEGIAEEQQSRIFEPFVTTRLADEHVGLGLAIVRTVVEQAGGGVEVDSLPGEGTAVRTYFPVQRTRSRSDQRAEAGEDPEAPTVLLVEDEADLRESYAELLRMDGYQVVVAADCEEAGAQVRTGEAPDVIVTDVVLPDGRAPRMVEELGEGLEGVPVVFVSGYGESPRREVNCEDCGPTTYLSKPFRVEALLTAVADLLAAGEATDQGPGAPEET